MFIIVALQDLLQAQSLHSHKALRQIAKQTWVRIGYLIGNDESTA